MSGEKAGLRSWGAVGDGGGGHTREEGSGEMLGLVIKQKAVTGINNVGLTVVNGDPVGVQFRHRIGGTRVERLVLFLRDLLHQHVQFRR